jgi:hypothetical protein
MNKSTTVETNYPLMDVKEFQNGDPIICKNTGRICLVTSHRESEEIEIIINNNQIIDIRPHPTILGCDTCPNSNL